MAKADRPNRSRDSGSLPASGETIAQGRLVRSYCALAQGPCVRSDVPEHIELKAVFLPYATSHSQTTATMRQVARAATDFVPLDWNELFSTGQPVFCEVCKATHRSQIVAPEMSRYNLNVAFEAGYAFGMRRHVVPLIDGTLAKIHVPSVIASITQVRYNEASDILRGLSRAASQSPRSDPDVPSDASVIRHPSALLYIMPPYRIDAVTAVMNRLERSASLYKVIHDDPQEIPDRSLQWYDSVLQDTPAVLVHLLGQDRNKQAEHNQKAAFLAGYAVARGRRVLMLQEASSGRIPIPIDYRDLLGAYRDHEHAVVLLESWLESFEAAIAREQTKAQSAVVRAHERGRLFQIDLGDPSAENEGELPSYYVDMSWTEALLSGNGLLYVGEKGTGKTAAIVQLASTLATPRHFFRSRSFEEYEIDRVLDVVAQNPDQLELRYAFGAIWKYLLLLDLAETYLHEAGPRLHLTGTPAAVELSRLVGPEPPVVRVAALVSGLRKEGPSDDRVVSVAQSLHKRTIPELVRVLANCLGGFETIHLALDNLDRLWDFQSPWGPQAMVELLLACQQLRRDFRRYNVDLKIAVFVRDDVHRIIHGVGADWTKIPVHSLTWTAAALKRVIVARLDRFEGRDPDEVWREFVTSMVRGERSLDFVLQRSFPRPRDVLVWLNESLFQARDAGHSQIEAEDIEAGERRYHGYLFDTWTVYVQGLPAKSDELLMGLAEVADQDGPVDVSSILAKAGVATEEVPACVDTLVGQGLLVSAATGQGQRLNLPLAERLLLVRRLDQLRVHPIVAAVFGTEST